MKERLRVVLIGAGRHAHRAYMEQLCALASRGDILLDTVVDLHEERDRVRADFSEHGHVPQNILGADRRWSDHALWAWLDSVFTGQMPDAVILSTEPVSHLPYLKWLVGRGVSTLVAKPPVLLAGASTDPECGSAMVTASEELLRDYKVMRHVRPDFFVSVGTHRRRYPIMQRAREYIRDVSDTWGVGVTSVISEHADGEWRSPGQILSQQYHPYNEGYGALGHSGYHIVDTGAHFLTEGRPADWAARLDLSGCAMALSPSDHVSQWNVPKLHERMEIKNDADWHMGEGFRKAPLGEVDHHAMVQLRWQGRVAATAAFHMQHGSVSHRTWGSHVGRDPYKGSGRLGQDTFIVHQGPLQTLRIRNWKSGTSGDDVYGPGGPRDFILEVFRNPLIADEGSRCERVHLREIDEVPEELFVAPEKDAMMRDFLASVRLGRGPRGDQNELARHELTLRIFARLHEWTSMS